MNARMGRTIRRWVWVCVFVIVGAFGGAPRLKAQTLTNADVIKMVRAKLGDAVIISEIEHSTCKFDTSPDALIKLKQAGVSNKILQVMTEVGHSESHAVSSAVASNSNTNIPVPENYGVYAAADGKLLGIDVPASTMTPQMVSVRLRSRVPLIPFPGSRPLPINEKQIPVLPSGVSFVQFGHGHKIDDGKLWVSPYNSVVDAWDFGGVIEGSVPTIQLLARPMTGHADVTIFAPAKPLAPNVYWVEADYPVKYFFFAVGHPGEFKLSHCFDSSSGKLTPCREGPHSALSPAAESNSSGHSTPLVLQVHVNAAIQHNLSQAVELLRTELRRQGIVYKSLVLRNSTTGVIVGLPAARQAVFKHLASNVLGPDFSIDPISRPGQGLAIQMLPGAVTQLENQVLQRTILTIKNRLNQLGVNGAIVRQNGQSSYEISVQLPSTEFTDHVERIIEAPAVLGLTLVTAGPFPSQEAAVSRFNGVLPPRKLLLRALERKHGSSATGQWYMLNQTPVVVDGDLRNVSAKLSSTGKWEVAFSLTGDAKRRFAEFSEANNGHRLAVVFNNQILEVSTIKFPISDQCKITDSFSRQSASDLALLLRSGPLPSPVTYLAQ